jgi:hypothetical protein
MTARQRRWTNADQARLEAALRLDNEDNEAFARRVAVIQAGAWSLMDLGVGRRRGRPRSDARP